jgi:hypothetical protein
MAVTTENRQMRYVQIVLSISAILSWLGALVFCGKWFQAWAEGRLEAGANTSLVGLLGFFLIVALLSIVGLYLGIQTWRDKVSLKWQIASLVTAVIMLWAVSGG